MYAWREKNYKIRPQTDRNIYAQFVCISSDTYNIRTELLNISEIQRIGGYYNKISVHVIRSHSNIYEN